MPVRRYRHGARGDLAEGACFFSWCLIQVNARMNSFQRDFHARDTGGFDEKNRQSSVKRKA
jgi:hypothetical protein